MLQTFSLIDTNEWIMNMIYAKAIYSRPELRLQDTEIQALSTTNL